MKPIPTVLVIGLFTFACETTPQKSQPHALIPAQESAKVNHCQWKREPDLTFGIDLFLQKCVFRFGKMSLANLEKTIRYIKRVRQRKPNRDARHHLQMKLLQLTVHRNFLLMTEGERESAREAWKETITYSRNLELESREKAAHKINTFDLYRYGGVSAFYIQSAEGVDRFLRNKKNVRKKSLNNLRHILRAELYLADHRQKEAIILFTKVSDRDLLNHWSMIQIGRIRFEKTKNKDDLCTSYLAVQKQKVICPALESYIHNQISATRD